MDVRIDSVLANEARVFLAPLHDASRSPLSLLLFLRQLGIELGGLVDAGAGLALGIQQVEAVISRFPGAEESDWLEIGLELFDAVQGIVATLRALLESEFDDEKALAEVEAALACLPSHLAVRYLDRRLPWVGAIFRALGWIDIARNAPCMVLRIDRFRASMDDFGGSLAELYSWGPGETWDRVRLFDAIAAVANKAGLSVSWAGLPDAWVEVDFIDERHAEGFHRLQVAVLPEPVEVGLQLAPFPEASDGPLEGLWFSPYSAVEGGEVSLGPLEFGLPVSLDALPAGVRVLPGGNVDILGRFPDEATFSVRLSEAVVAGPITLAGLMASVTLGEEGPDVRVDLPDGGLVLRVPAGDGLLGEAIPDGVELAIAFTATWTKADGLTVEGAAGTEILLVPEPTTAPVQLTWLRARLGISTEGLEADATAGVAVRIGAVQATVEGMGAGVEIGLPEQDGGRWDVQARLVPPTGIGLVIGDPDSEVHGGGFLSIEEDRYAGAMTLHIGDVALDALALLTTGDDWSLLVMVTASFPAIALGYGFFLTGVGGLLALNRDLDVGALDEGLSDGILEPLLFPENVVTDATVLLAGLERIFPRAPGRFSGGLFVQIEYGEGGFWLTEVGLLLSVPNPIRVALVGTSTITLPPGAEEPVSRIQLAVLGAYDGGAKVLTIRAELVDSFVGPLRLRGGALFRASFGAEPSFVLSIGGFHPEFTPPAGVVPPERLGADLELGILTLYLAAYFAVTPNTIQIGSHVRVEAELAIARIRGEFRFDALVHLSPLSFVVDLMAELALETPRGKPLLSIRVELVVTGPRPMAVDGQATVKILGIEKTVQISGSSGGRADRSTLAPVDPLHLVGAALEEPSAWQVLADPALDLPAMVVAGSQVVQVRQKVLPLEQPLDHLHSHPTGGRQAVYLHVGSAESEAVQAPFATASFTTLTDDEALAAPAFTDHPAGARIRSTAAKRGAATSVAVDRVVRVRADGSPVTATLPPRPEAA